MEAVRQDGTMEVDITHILQIAQRPAASRSLKDMDILAVWLSNKLRKNQLFDSITIAMCTALAQDAQITSLSPTGTRAATALQAVGAVWAALQSG